jgi:hypothetical protein
MEHAGTEARAIAEALADVLVERGLVVERTAGPAARVLDVGQVADLLGRRPAWVYAHAAELGVFRFGDGLKPALGSTASAWSVGSATGRSRNRRANRDRGNGGPARRADRGGRD